jgi:hypothetical protein
LAKVDAGVFLHFSYVPEVEGVFGGGKGVEGFLDVWALDVD